MKIHLTICVEYGEGRGLRGIEPLEKSRHFAELSIV
jgi:hypothetical protein